jgi:hypothetical protein
MFKNFHLRQTRQQPTIKEAVAMVLAHLQPVDQITQLKQGDHNAIFEVIVTGAQTKLEFTIDISTSFRANEAFVTTRFFLFDPQNPHKADSLFVGDTLVGEKVTKDHPGPALVAARAIIDAIHNAAELLTARSAGAEAYNEAKRVEKFGTANQIRLEIPYDRKDEAKANHHGRLTWNKAEHCWYYAGDTLPDDLSEFIRPDRTSPPRG